MNKYFGVDNEMTSLKTQILIKDNEITTLKMQLKKSGGSIPEMPSDMEDDLDDESERESAKPRAPPSPDKDLADFFAEGGGGSFGNL